MNTNDTFRTQLNDEQYEAVTYCDGPSLVIAGAGSGKTRVLTYKIAYLLQHGFMPWNILALTFTNKAAREMNQRISVLCANQNVRGIWSGTFHSIFAKVLRLEHEVIGYPQSFTIYDTTDSRSLIKAIVKEMMLDDKVYKPNIVASHISEAKNHLILPAAYAAEPSIRQRDSAEGLGAIAKIYATYQQRLRAAGAMDFEDLLLNMFLLLRDHADVRERYVSRFQYVLVDEYQDTNLAQHRILSLLTNENSRICVVGDDAQSIYGFRGADITNILNFQKQYPSAKVIKLECNYRSTHNIVEAANCIIKNNSRQIPKKVFSAGEEGAPILLMASETDKEEAQKVLSQIIKLHRKHNLPYDSIAILYRTNAQSRSLEEALKGVAIPYKIYGGQSFYQRKEIKDVLAYCRMVANTDDDEAFRRIINYPTRGIGATTMLKVQNAAMLNSVSMWAVISNAENYNLEISKGALGKLIGFQQLIMSAQELATEATASHVVKHLIRTSGIAIDLAKDRSAEGTSRQENIDELLGSIEALEKEARDEEGRTMVQLNEYLSTISLLSDADTEKEEQPSVTLMTVHSSKGLEFDAVFVTGMEENLFPNANAKYSTLELEEERRLFYVAVTRAKRYCFLTYAKTRYKYGSLQFCDPSEFLNEIDDKYIQEEQLISRHDSSKNSSFGIYTRSYPEDNYRSMADDDALPSFLQPTKTELTRPKPSYTYNNDKRPSQPYNTYPSSSKPKSYGRYTFTIGSRVQHERLGKGVVVSFDGSGDSAKVKVNFEEGGVKNLLIKFANLKTI